MTRGQTSSPWKTETPPDPWYGVYIRTSSDDIALEMIPLITEGNNIWGARWTSGLSLVRATQPDLSDAEVVATLPGGFSNAWITIVRVATGKLAAYVRSSDEDQEGFYTIDDSDPDNVTYARKEAGFANGYPISGFQCLAIDTTGQYLFCCSYGAYDGSNVIYRSADYGETWGLSYTHVTAARTHIHCVEFDPYINRVWACIGDMGAGGRPGIAYSDNYGVNWTLFEGDGTQMHTCIIPVSDGVLFGTDRAPAGVLKWTAPGGANVVVTGDFAQVQYAQAGGDTLSLGFAGRPIVDLSGASKIIIPFGNIAAYAESWLCGGEGTSWTMFNVDKDPDVNDTWVRYFAGLTPPTEDALNGWVIGVGPQTTPQYIIRFRSGWAY